MAGTEDDTGVDYDWDETGESALLDPETNSAYATNADASLAGADAFGADTAAADTEDSAGAAGQAYDGGGDAATYQDLYGDTDYYGQVQGSDELYGNFGTGASAADTTGQEDQAAAAAEQSAPDDALAADSAQLSSSSTQQQEEGASSARTLQPSAAGKASGLRPQAPPFYPRGSRPKIYINPEFLYKGASFPFKLPPNLHAIVRSSAGAQRPFGLQQRMVAANAPGMFGGNGSTMSSMHIAGVGHMGPAAMMGGMPMQPLPYQQMHPGAAMPYNAMPHYHQQRSHFQQQQPHRRGPGAMGGHARSGNGGSDVLVLSGSKRPPSHMSDHGDPSAATYSRLAPRFASSQSNSYSYNQQTLLDSDQLQDAQYQELSSQQDPNLSSSSSTSDRPAKRAALESLPTMSIAVVDQLAEGTSDAQILGLASEIAPVTTITIDPSGTKAEIGFSTEDGALRFRRKFNKTNLNGAFVSVSIKAT